MFSLERTETAELLATRSCRCGAGMQPLNTKIHNDFEIQIFRCSSCSHELQLTVWRDDNNNPEN